MTCSNFMISMVRSKDVRKFKVNMGSFKLAYTYLQICEGIQIVFFLYLQENKLWVLLEAPQGGASNSTHNKFQWRYKRSIRLSVLFR